jgi:carboxymethylenebutenolidase
MEAVSNLPTDQVMGDLNAVADYAKKLPSANGKLAVAGFCWGGGQSFHFATVRPDLSAAFVFYGTPPDAGDMAKINAPVFGFYGGDDNRVTSTVGDATAEMAAADKKYDPSVYEGAGHGFMRAGEAPDAKDANKKAHDAAWIKWLYELSKI